MVSLGGKLRPKLVENMVMVATLDEAYVKVEELRARELQAD